MIPHHLSAVITQQYYRDGDEAVAEILVFLGTEAFNRFESSERSAPELAAFWVRSIKTSDGDYVGTVRLGSGERILETTYRDRSQMQMLRDTLSRLLPNWELKGVLSSKVPDRNPFDGKL